VFSLPFSPTRRNLTIVSVLLLVFLGALAVRLVVTFHYGLPLGRDGPYHLFHVQYLADHWPFPHNNIAPTHQLFFHFAVAVYGFLSAFGASLISSFNVAASLASALVVPTTFFMMRRFTGNVYTALTAAFFSAFIPASLRMFGELEKNAFAVSITPLAVLLLWRSLRDGKKLDYVMAGLVLGAIGLTHELVFGVLVITFVSYLALLLAYQKRFPMKEFKRMVVIGAIAGVICGYFYLQSFGTITSMGGQPAMVVAAQEGPPPYEKPPDFSPSGADVGGPAKTISGYLSPVVIILSAVGVGVSAYRKRPHDLFLLAWMFSAVAMAQPWVMSGYEWRFTLMLATPAALLAAVGLMEGIMPALWNNRLNLKISKNVPKTGFVALLAVFLLIQSSITWNYAWEGEMMQPTISKEQYNSLIDFYESYGSAYAFRLSFPIYWPDAVGLKSDIAGGSVISSLSKEEPNYNLDLLISEWSEAQAEVGDNIYALIDPNSPGFIQETDNIVKVFSGLGLLVYALSENSSPSSGMQLYSSLATQQAPPPEEEPREKFEIKNILLAPIYLMPGAMRFILGVPLTVFCWVFVPSVVWSSIRSRSKNPEKLRKWLLVLLVIFFAWCFLPM